ncbi:MULTISPECIES: hypothetical protein [Achromobacter]|uniref:Uncharacterized protein n=1 Tax=Achromobacter spanius TaxID=217203 RepID=A0ABY8H108_9BURK|nr:MULTISPECIES: hypothetical protein [Achromobacter]WAI85764.1 hypothetical protein N8Z00_12105 [Achromobacter spanius]WEX95845.1 hypothetical protein N3Z32_06695 [Achromobacter sp. SS2-2022]WFP10434.1 hypothetical protein P8T11_11385 [Achromobacter spanius]
MNESEKLPFALAVPSATSVLTPDDQQWADFFAKEEAYIAYVMPAGRALPLAGPASTNCGTYCGTVGNGLDDISNDISEDTA